MCLAAMSDYDVETQRLICELEAMLIARRKKQLEKDPAMRARANRFMPAAAAEVLPLPCAEAAAAGSHQEMAA